jgi:hypothetical protein
MWWQRSLGLCFQLQARSLVNAKKLNHWSIF